MIPHELVTGLRPVQRRLQGRRVRLGSVRGLVGGAGAAILLLVTARFTPILHSGRWEGLLVGLGLVGGLLWGVFRRPTLREAAAPASSKQRSVNWPPSAGRSTSPPVGCTSRICWLPNGRNSRLSRFAHPFLKKI